MSWSHSADELAVVIADVGPVGIDLELITGATPPERELAPGASSCPDTVASGAGMRRLVRVDRGRGTGQGRPLRPHRPDHRAAPGAVPRRERRGRPAALEQRDDGRPGVTAPRRSPSALGTPAARRYSGGRFTISTTNPGGSPSLSRTDAGLPMPRCPPPARLRVGLRGPVPRRGQRQIRYRHRFPPDSRARDRACRYQMSATADQARPAATSSPGRAATWWPGPAPSARCWHR